MLPLFNKLKPHYRSGDDDLAADFFSPCLKGATLYRRAAGYFSSLALLTWADALPRLIGDNVLRIRLIASPELSPQDIMVFKELQNSEKRVAYRQLLADRILEEIIALTERPSDHGVRAKIMAWLVANNLLEIRFAFPRHVEASGIFHEKIGVFNFPDGEKVAFTGSANETLGGHHRNYESIDVYRSWVAGDAQRVQTKVDQFDEAWVDDASGLDVRAPSPDVGRQIAFKGTPRSTEKWQS